MSRDLIEREAGAHRLEPDLVSAIVSVESSFNPWAWNPEPHYRYLWNVKTRRPFRRLTPTERATEVPPVDFPYLAGDRDQEWWAQQASWGLMQLMGALARERGFKGLYLTELVDPELNLSLGCGHLASLLAWSKGDEAKALGAYNAGRGGWSGPQGRAYAAKVRAAKELERAR